MTTHAASRSWDWHDRSATGLVSTVSSMAVCCYRAESQVAMFWCKLIDECTQRTGVTASYTQHSPNGDWCMCCQPSKIEDYGSIITLKRQ